MRVLLAVPPGLLGEALERMIGEVVPQAQVTTVAIDGTDPLVLPQVDVGLVLIDVDSLADRAPAAIAQCASTFRVAPIVAVANPGDARVMDQVLRAGATGYLPKNYSHSMMQAVLRLVLEGAAYRPVLTETAAPAEAPTLADLGLTPRQTEVLSLLAQGKSNEAIARQLGISVGVVKLHVNAIFKALDVQSRTEAVLIAVRYGVVSPQQLRDAEHGRFNLDWLLPHMHHRHFKKDSIVFRIGDPGEQLFYLQRGTVSLVELQREMHAGDLFGEVAIFSPDHRRTSTAQCVTEADVFSLDAEQVRRIYASNPQFALYLIYLIARRLMADRQRAA
ncbi:MAG TPA: LuxR C-terminal-related transcriptional regulator [Burkholderiales bacterium]|jgi:two-component system nitrate/nitrite response regulator NarL|nr:LuxR C-terminal-related transcriptional regulator [Burkholderiales bacterium]